MDYHKTMFKAQTTQLSQRDHNNENRERHRVARSKRREECFQSNRMISVSPPPTSIKKMELAPATAEQENQQPEKVSKKKAYMERFMKWKVEAKQRAAAETPATAAAEAAAVFVPPKRQSLYVTVKLNEALEKNKKQTVSRNVKQPSNKPTAVAKKPLVETKTYAHSTAAAALDVKSKPETNARKPQASTQAPLDIGAEKTKLATTVRKPLGSSQVTATAAASAKLKTITKKPTEIAATAVKPKPTTNTKKLAPPIRTAMTTVRQPTKELHVGSKPAVAARAITKPQNLRTEPFDKPKQGAHIVKPIRGGARIVKPIQGGVSTGGAAGKFKAADVQKTVKSNVPSLLSRCMKAKKPTAGNSKQKLFDQAPNLRQQLLEITTNLDLPATPLELATIDHNFNAQATSTQCKSNNLIDVYKELTNISPVTVEETTKTTSHTSSVKRQLIPAEPEAHEPPKRKFNFARYSEANSLLESPQMADSQHTLMPATAEVSDYNGVEEKTIVPQTELPQTDLPQTPPAQNLENKSNYLSPYVSVSRGKVSCRIERKNRNSIYLQELSETPVAVRRTLETVKYFRHQLENEIKNLNGLCDVWNLYSTENEEHLVETGGKDMIDAAIGQTKLLTTKKLMQFSSLIDRCEAGATGVGLRPNDGSEATKPVLAEDLEGWWDMVRLQSDNVDKRFNNLTRWKENNWSDPDAVIQTNGKTKSTVRPQPKPKLNAKPSSNLKSFLRKAFADKRKNQATEALAENSSPVSRRSKSRVVVVKDRRSFSPVPTVLRMSSGGNLLLRCALETAASEKKSYQQTPPPPSQTPKRMSILKTPGTKKRETITRGVMFSAKKTVRRFQFAVEEQLNSDEEHGFDKLEDCEEDMTLERSHDGNTASTSQGDISRTYSLRTRKIKLRPSSEFM